MDAAQPGILNDAPACAPETPAQIDVLTRLKRRVESFDALERLPAHGHVSAGEPFRFASARDAPAQQVVSALYPCATLRRMVLIANHRDVGTAIQRLERASDPIGSDLMIRVHEGEDVTRRQCGGAVTKMTHREPGHRNDARPGLACRFGRRVDGSVVRNDDLDWMLGPVRANRLEAALEERGHTYESDGSIYFKTPAAPVVVTGAIDKRYLAAGGLTSGLGWPTTSNYAVPGGERVDFDKRYVRKDGTVLWARMSVAPILDSTGGPVCFVAQVEDVTERRAADSRMRDSERRFRLLVQGVTDYAIYMLTPQGEIASWNAGAQRIKGYAEHEVLGRQFALFFTAEDRATGKPERALETARSTGRFADEGWRLRKDGSRFWALAVLDAIHDERGELVGFAVNCAHQVDVGGAVVQIAAGGSHTCALLDSGAVRCFGSNENGQLGDGATTDRASPSYVVWE